MSAGHGEAEQDRADQRLHERRASAAEADDPQADDAVADVEPIVPTRSRCCTAKITETA